MLRKAGNDIGAAAEELTLLEAEHAGQQKVVTATRKAAVAAKQPMVRWGPDAEVVGVRLRRYGAAGVLPAPSKMTVATTTLGQSMTCEWLYTLADGECPRHSIGSFW